MTDRYQSLSTLVKVMSGALVLYAVTSVLVGVFHLGLVSALEPGPLPEARIIIESKSYWPIVVVDILLFLTLVILFCVWVHRGNANARALGAQSMRFSPGWAVGWFFVPFMNLFRPYQVVREVWKASAPEVSSRWEQLQTPVLVKAWWAMLLVSWLVFGSNLSLSGPIITAEMIRFLIAKVAISVLTHVGSCILALLLVQNIHQRQEAKAARVQIGIGG